MIIDLTEVEEEFIRNAVGNAFTSLWDTIDGTNTPTAITEATDAARKVVETVERRFDNRVERLLAFTALAKEMDAAREALLRSIIRAQFHWSRNKHNHDWMASGFQAWDVRALASVSGVTQQKVRAIIREESASTLKAAKEVEIERQCLRDLAKGCDERQ
jgi:hypothetical protein